MRLSAFDSDFIDKQLAGVVVFYDQQLAELEKAIKVLVEAAMLTSGPGLSGWWRSRV